MTIYSEEEARGSIIKYKKSGKIDDLTPAITYLSPLIKQRAAQFRNVEIPQYVLISKGQEYIVDNIHKYDPERASLNTFAYNNLKQLRRYVIARQNTARIPEHKAIYIGRFHSAQQHLKEQLERDPAPSELADELGWSTGRVDKLMRAQRGSRISDEETQKFLPQFNPIEDKVHIIYYSLSPEEQVVFDYLTGAHGRPKLKLKQIAKKMNRTYSSTYKIKQSLMEKLKKT